MNISKENIKALKKYFEENKAQGGKFARFKSFEDYLKWINE